MVYPMFIMVVIMNLLEEEIRAIKHTMSHLRMAIPLELDYGRKKRLENDYRELGKLLEDKLNQCEDYKG